MGLISDWWNKRKVAKSDITDITVEPKALDDDSRNLFARMSQQEKDLKAANQNQKYIICNGKKYAINWSKVLLWTDKGGLSLPKNCYQSKSIRKPTMFVTHWDVCLSTASMVKVIIDRGLSVHFGIDNDGTIYQLLDTKEIAWHAKGVNTTSIGVEIANGVSLKYADYYTKQGLPAREVIKSDIIHGVDIGPYLGFYPQQVEALKALTQALHKAHDIPLEVPKDKNGKYLKGVSPEVANGTFKGVVGHFHVTTNKNDPGNLPLEEIVEDLKKL